MEGKSLVIGATYLFRLADKKQIPVRFAGWQERTSPNLKPLLVLESLDGNATYYRMAARALSKHYDSCALGRENCDCAARLTALTNRA